MRCWVELVVFTLPNPDGSRIALVNVLIHASGKLTMALFFGKSTCYRTKYPLGAMFFKGVCEAVTALVV